MHCIATFEESNRLTANATARMSSRKMCLVCGKGFSALRNLYDSQWEYICQLCSLLVHFEGHGHSERSNIGSGTVANNTSCGPFPIPGSDGRIIGSVNFPIPGA